MSDRPTRSEGLKDWLLYAAIAIAVVISIWIFAVHQARTGGSPKLPLKWLGFAGLTIIVFGYATNACRRLWDRQRFWVYPALFFLMHLGLGIVVLLRVPAVRLVLYALLTAVEYAILTAYFGYFLDLTQD